MPDWQRLVRQRLSGLALDPAEKEEVHAELAAHLEESYGSLRTKGMPEEAAMQQTLAQVADWDDLKRRIHSARMGKDTMTNRVKQFWLPGLLTFTLSMGLLELVQKLAGAIGACLSKRAGGSRRMTLLSSTFPVLPLAAVFLMAIPVGLVLSHTLSHGIVAAAFLTLGIAWVAVPGLVLLVGGWLAQLFLSRRLDSRGIVSH